MGIDAMPPRAGGLPARLILGSALRAQSDRRLVRLVREGHEGAFEEIVRRYRGPLDRFAASIVGPHADDVTQDSFRKALVALRDGDADVELRPWLYRIVRNTALTDLRDRPPAAAELAEELVAGGRSAAAEAEQRAEVAELAARLRALPENQRAALVMRELEGLSHEEIAAALGVSAGAARQAIARARAAVRSGLGALVPLPVLRLLAGGGGAAGAGATVGGGAAVAGAGALKVAVATVVVAGAVGAGVAIEQHHSAGQGPNGPQASISGHRARSADPRPSSAPRPTATAKRHRTRKPVGRHRDRARPRVVPDHHPVAQESAAGGVPRLVVAAPPASAAVPGPVPAGGGGGQGSRHQGVGVEHHASPEGGGTEQEGGGSSGPGGPPHESGEDPSGGGDRGSPDDSGGDGAGPRPEAPGGDDGPDLTAETPPPEGAEAPASGSDDPTIQESEPGDGPGPSVPAEISP